MRKRSSTPAGRSTSCARATRANPGANASPASTFTGCRRAAGADRRDATRSNTRRSARWRSPRSARCISGVDTTWCTSSGSRTSSSGARWCRIWRARGSSSTCATRCRSSSSRATASPTIIARSGRLLLEERISCRYATHVLTVIDAMRDLFLRSVAPEKITVVRNAPDPRLFSRSGELPARDPADRTLLYAGTVADRYGVDLIVERGRAGSRMRSPVSARGSSATVTSCPEVAGDRAGEHGIEDRVSLDGPVPLDAMPGIISTPGSARSRIGPIR